MSTPSDRSERPSARPGGPESLVGVVLSGRYQINKLIGEGGMGAVYQAEHTHMRKRFAIKVLHPEMSRLSEVVARFEREAMAAAHIEHPNVAGATDFGKLEDGSFFLVLEYVEGKSLREAISEGRLELGRALRVARQIASALGRAHALGIVHRDLKPENVMLVTREGDPDFVKVLDFGIAKVPVGLTGEPKTPGVALTQVGMVYGTPEYMAPEQALGQPVDATADLYALGVILFEMITGKRPYDHESKVTLLGMHVTAPIPRMGDRAPGANVPPQIEAIVTRLLAKESTARFADARELIDALDAITAHLAALGQIAEPPPPLSSLGQSPRASSPKLNESLASGASLGLRQAPGEAGDVPSALGPTSLAQPSASHTNGAAQSLASLMDVSLGQVFRAAPAWATPRRMMIAASAVGALLLLLVVVFVAGARGGAAPSGSARPGGSAASPVPWLSDHRADEAVAEAQAKIDKGDFATAIDTLTGIEKKGPDRADVHMLLQRAYTGTRSAREAMREAGLWLAADPGAAAADMKLQEDVRNAALVKDGQEEAFALLESKMGTRGIDILYDIAYGNSGRLYPQAAARAKHSLSQDEVRGRASPALSVLLDFSDAKGCEAKHELLDRARQQGDARMLSVLQKYQPTRGCGFLGVTDCYPCLHRDQSLRDAMSAIEDRSVK
jgi:serine/threonine protein kinase